MFSTRRSVPALLTLVALLAACTTTPTPQPQPPIKLPPPVGPVPVPPAQQALPKQEPGLRWSRALPYRLEAEAVVDVARGVRRVTFDNKGEAGAVFLVHAAGSDKAPRTYTVEARKQLVDEWPLTGDQADGQNLTVSGPGGFYREFKGALDGLIVRLQQGHEGDMRLSLRNEGKSPLALSVSRNAYAVGSSQAHRKVKLSPGANADLHWPLKDALGWYDIAITAEGQPDFLYRWAGRVETGRPSVSDPAIGTARPASA